MNETFYRVSHIHYNHTLSQMHQYNSRSSGCHPFLYNVKNENVVLAEHVYNVVCFMTEAVALAPDCPFCSLNLTEIGSLEYKYQ